jgi:hypothetical protein
MLISQRLIYRQKHITVLHYYPYENSKKKITHSYVRLKNRSPSKQRMEMAKVINSIKNKEDIFDPNFCALKVMGLEFTAGY